MAAAAAPSSALAVDEPCLIVGGGRLGWAWACELAAAGFTVVRLWNRRTRPVPEGIEAVSAALAAIDLRAERLVLLCVSDDAIEAVAGELARNSMLAARHVVFHCSGLKGSAALAALRFSGCALGSLHPLQSFPPCSDPGRMAGVFFAVEGDPRAVAYARALARRVGGHPRVFSAAQKPLYHAAAVVASNLLVATIDAAVAIARRAGFEADDALAVLLPLVRGSVENLASVGLPDALTGPIARGDRGVIAAHLEALAATPELAELYRVLSRHAVAVADRQRRLPGAELAAIATLLEPPPPPVASRRGNPAEPPDGADVDGEVDEHSLGFEP